MEEFNRTRFLREQYVARINAVMDHIENNLRRELTLDALAAVAGFSRFHFHRIFRVLVGETLNQFIQRVRLEKAAVMLINNPRESITSIALDCGFSSSATFARTFKDAYGMSASEWRGGGYLNYSNNSKMNRKIDQTRRKRGKEFASSSGYTDAIVDHRIRRMSMNRDNLIKVEVKEIPEWPVAYIRHIGLYQGDGELFDRLVGRLMKWAGPRGLLQFPATKVLTIYHDNPEITDVDSLRISVCITVPEDTQVSGEVGKASIPAGKYAFARFELAVDEYGEAWETACGWMLENGYQFDDRPTFELYHNDPDKHPEKKHIVDICIPVKPL